jgi:hypothetical protein
MQTLAFEPLSTPAPPVQSGAGGCDFAADPTLRATEADVFWLPDVRASIVILAATPAESAALSFAPSDWPGLRARRAVHDGEHLILRSGRDEHQLWLPDPPQEGSSLAAVIPLDEATLQRADAAMRFWRHTTGQRVRADPSSHTRRARIDKALRALDGHLHGVTYRVIAESLFSPARIAAEPWKTASLRDTTIRLVRNGVALMRGGYRNFLRR